jgi:hypothetical protein
MKEIIIYQPWGGLGDNLAHTPIPRVCQELGYKCLLSKHNAFRHPQIFDLLYKDLDCIHGTTDEINESWQTGYTQINEPGWNHIRHVQLGYGFEKAPYYYPLINYQPKFINELKNVTLVDLSGDHCYTYFPHLYNEQNLLKITKRLIEVNKLKNIITVEKNNIDNSDIKITEESYKINSLFDYADILFSCKNFICIDSGPGNLACTIKNQFKTNCNIYIIGMSLQLPPKKYDTYNYVNANYITSDTHEIIRSYEN